MKYHLRILTAVLGVLWPCISMAESDVEGIFGAHYTSRYQARRCETNVSGFLKQVAGARMSRNRFVSIHIKNRGLSVFGMVNAESARDFLRGQPSIEEKNWDYHVIAMDENGLIYDFDFMVKPTIVDREEYFTQMFLVEDECSKGSRARGFCAGEEQKLKDYQLTMYAAEDVVNSRRVVVWQGSLESFLQRDLSEFFPGR